MSIGGRHTHAQTPTHPPTLQIAQQKLLGFHLPGAYAISHLSKDLKFVFC